MSVHSTPSDAELIVRAKNADTDAIALIYERYHPPIYRYIYHRVSNAEQAEDLCADVFVAMLESIGSYEDRGWPLSAWLYRIAHSRTVDAVRRSIRRPQTGLTPTISGDESPEFVVGNALLRDELQHALAFLTPDQRTVILLRFCADMPIQLVAQHIGRSEHAVKSLQHRAIQSLARHMRVSAA
jgi:RNA polymerase sigma-70 factor, ECF subfamily